MKIATLICRILLGVLFLMFGLNGFLNFIPAPPLPHDVSGELTKAFMDSHYMIPVSALEIIASLLFLANRYVPIALVLLGPILVNILLFHILTMPAGLPPGIIATLLFLVVFKSHFSAFKGIFVAKVPEPEDG